jgi:hypothetical protein
MSPPLGKSGALFDSVEPRRSLPPFFHEVTIVPDDSPASRSGDPADQSQGR